MHGESCRLCDYDAFDRVNIYSDEGVAGEYAKKITRYLYLYVTPNDDLSKSICWMCSQQLDSFHRFHEKINEIQQRLLGVDRYLQYVVHHSFDDDSISEQSSLKNNVSLEAIISSEDQQSAEQEEQQGGPMEDEEDDSTLQLIPCSRTDDSFIVVKSESIETSNSSEQDLHEASLVEIDSKSEIQVFEIYRSTRKKRSELETTDADQTSGGEEEIQLKQMNPHVSGRVTKDPLKTIRDVRTSPRRTKNEKGGGEQGTTNINIDESELSEGDSADEFPARDSDNEEWPAAEAMEKFPTVIIKDGLLTIKGKRLMDMINSFFNLQCDLCKIEPMRFKTFPELFDHHKTKHGQEGYVLCCQSKFTRYPSIIMHMARHIQPEAFKCEICGYMVTRPRFLAVHRQTHLPDDQKPYACEHCPKRFCWKRALQVHLNSHKGPEDRTVYVCPLCEKTYDTPGGLSAHKKNVHTAPRTSKVLHVCEVCAKTFVTTSGLKEHMTTIHQHREKGQLQCHHCSKWLMNSRCLKVHMQLHSEIDLACDECTYKCKKPGLLKRHKIMHHQEERPFGCNQCDATFKQKRALTTHIKLKHSERKPSHQCNFCDRKFASSTNFYSHRKNNHPEQLAAMKEKLEQDKKLQRIKAGIEPDDVPIVHESTRTDTVETRVISVGESLGTMIVLKVSDRSVSGLQENSD